MSYDKFRYRNILRLGKNKMKSEGERNEMRMSFWNVWGLLEFMIELGFSIELRIYHL